MASAQIKQNRERDTLWADFKLFLLYFLMSHVVWLSQSIKIVLLSVLSPRNISCKCSPWTQADKKWRHLRSGPLGHGFVIWTTWIKGSSLLKGGKLFFFFFLCLPSALFLPPLLCLPSSVAQPCSLPCCSSGAHRSARFWWLVSMSINWEISYYHENDFILRWTILYHLLYLSHRAQCCTLGRQINLSSWNVYCFI